MMNLKHLLNKNIILIFVIGVCGCARMHTVGSILKYKKNRYSLTDKSGSYWLLREAGVKTEKDEFIVKRRLVEEGENEGSPLEKSVSISKVRTLKDKITVLAPFISQYTVWLDGQKYFNEIKIADDNKSILLKLQSPEEKWNGIQKIDFPSVPQILCFYSQIVECASVAGFIEKSLKYHAGKMHFHIIWDGYPYFQQQYVGVQENIVEKATLQYDGLLKEGENRFSLDVSGQVIFYIVNNKGRLIKQFWVSQGLSMVVSK